MLRPKTVVACAALTIVIALGGCAHRIIQPPAIRIGSSREVGPRLSNYSEATVPADGMIVVRSDDFVGSEEALAPPRKGKPVRTISLADALARATGLKVVDQSKPGEPLAAAAARLKEAPVGNLMIISYGYGDAANPSDADFDAGLIDMIHSAQAGGAAVYLVTEPETKAPLSGKVDTYRTSFRAHAAIESAGLIDSPSFLSKAELGPSKTAVQPKAAVDLIAGNLATYIKVAPARSP